MPKSAKKKKDKAADFSKAKLKLGKGKQTPSNTIDTSFKARTIALPQQSITTTKDETAPTTRKKLSLDNLVSHLKHYNAGTRKDALLGFRELLEDHRELIEPSLVDILNSCARVIADDDASVRKALHSFMSWLLPLLPPETLLPHSPLLLLFTSSAQTHIFPVIRVDAVKFLDLLLEYVPDTVVSGWCDGNGGHGARVLEGYLGLLSAGTKFGGAEGPARATSTASVVLTPSSKLVVLESLASFLSYALALKGTKEVSATSSIPTWFLESSIEPVSAFESFNNSIQPQKPLTSRTWQPDEDPETGQDGFVHLYPVLREDPNTPHTLSDILSIRSLDQEDPQDNIQKSLTQLAQSLHSTLIATYLDSAPAVFTPSRNPNETELRLVVAVCQICRCIYGTLLRSSQAAQEDAIEGLKPLLGYMAPHFPFVAHGNRDIKAEQTFQDLNLIYCELNSLLSLHLAKRTLNPSRRDGKQRAFSFVDAERVRHYVIQLLTGETATNSNVAGLGRSLTPAQYVALLPTIWSLLNDDAEDHDELLTAVLDHASRSGCKSAIKKLTIEFVGRLVLLDSCARYRGKFRIQGSNLSPTMAWVEHLPKVLWELGTGNAACSEAVIRILLRLCQRRSSSLPADFRTAVNARLAPLFLINHPTKGELLGPWVKLPPLLRRLALDLAAVLVADVKERDVLETAVGRALRMMEGDDERLYWIGIRQGL